MPDIGLPGRISKALPHEGVADGLSPQLIGRSERVQFVSGLEEGYTQSPPITLVLVETSVDLTVPHTPAPEFVCVATFHSYRCLASPKERV